jgi:hypothetical protein
MYHTLKCFVVVVVAFFSSGAKDSHPRQLIARESLRKKNKRKERKSRKGRKKGKEGRNKNKQMYKRKMSGGCRRKPKQIMSLFTSPLLIFSSHYLIM